MDAHDGYRKGRRDFKFDFQLQQRVSHARGGRVGSVAAPLLAIAMSVCVYERQRLLALLSPADTHTHTHTGNAYMICSRKCNRLRQLP